MSNGYKAMGKDFVIKEDDESTRVIVDNAWSFEIPEGFTYVVDPKPATDNVPDYERIHILIRHNNPDVEFWLMDAKKYPTVEDVRNAESLVEMGQFHFGRLSYQVYKDDGDFIIVMAFYGTDWGHDSAVPEYMNIYVRREGHKGYDLRWVKIRVQGFEEQKECLRKIINTIQAEN